MSIATMHRSTPTPDAAILPTLCRRALAEWPAKLVMLAVLPAVFLAGYVATQRLSPSAPTPVLDTPIDHLLSFHAMWVWPYVSLYPFLPLAPLLGVRRRQLVRYTLGLTAMSLVAFVVFYFVPTSAPRVHLAADPPTNWLYDLLLVLDLDANACPSLHAGLVVYSLLFAWRVLGDPPMVGRRTRLLVVAVLLAWSVVILLGTMGTKQHRFIDLIGGGAVAMLGHVVAWTWLPRDPAARD